MDFYLTALLQGLCLGTMAFGIYLSMKIFNIPDITTDGSYTLGGAITGIMLANNLSSAVIYPTVLFAGLLAGAATGFIHTKLKINALLSGILVMTALYSVNLSLMGRSNIPLLNNNTLFSWINITDDFNINALIILVVFVGIILSVVAYLLKTDFGLAMRATGNSETMIRSLGVDTDKMKIIGLALANALTATSGYLISQLQSFADINMGIGIVIVGLGSVIIGETIISWLSIKNIWIILFIVMVGAIVFQMILALSLSLGINPNLLKLITALFVLMIVSLPKLSSKLSNDKT